MTGVRRPRWSSMLFTDNYCFGTRAVLHVKMLKETKNEETRLFVKFLSLLAFRLWGPGTPGPPPWLRL